MRFGKGGGHSPFGMFSSLLCLCLVFLLCWWWVELGSHVPPCCLCVSAVLSVLVGGGVGHPPLWSVFLSSLPFFMFSMLVTPRRGKIARHKPHPFVAITLFQASNVCFVVTLVVPFGKGTPHFNCVQYVLAVLGVQAPRQKKQVCVGICLLWWWVAGLFLL